MNMTATDQIESVQGEAKNLPLYAIEKIEGHNPRRIRAKNDVDDMRESIRHQGVMQSILVRPHPTKPGKYQLIAGETRYDLALEVGLTVIPANIRQIADEDLRKAAISENLHRNDMSPVDEGQAAQQLLADGNDKDEVCRILGWNRQKLDGRIQLTHCSDDVAQALIDKKITIGHAQALSSLRETSQAKVLTVTLKNEWTVDELRQKLDELSLKLSAASFDTSECAACPHNSSTQASLFDAQTSRGQCLNRACFEQKHKAHLDKTRDELAESHNRVAFTDEVAKNTTRIIVSTGRNGVGQQQITACHTCAHYGAVIDTAIGQRAAVTQGVCFNPACHSEKVTEYQNAINPETAAP